MRVQKIILKILTIWSSKDNYKDFNRQEFKIFQSLWIQKTILKILTIESSKNSSKDNYKDFTTKDSLAIVDSKDNSKDFNHREFKK